jgi:hypothetical protein
MSLVTFSFNPINIPAKYRTVFMVRFTEMVLEYETLVEPTPPSPPADTLPLPTSFAPVPGDEVVPPTSGPKSLERMTSQELRDRRADLMGFGADHPQRRRTAKFPKKDDLVVEIRRLESLDRRLSADSLDAPAPAPVVAEAVVVTSEPSLTEPAVADSGSETNTKKPRKNVWDTYTPEQKAERLAKMQAAREAKRLAAATATATVTDTAPTVPAENTNA